MSDNQLSLFSDPLLSLLEAKEHERLEFKEARNRFDFEKLVRYCAALANEGGGQMILGITDKRPRQIVGTQAFPDLDRTKSNIGQELHLRITAEEQMTSMGRVVIFTVPPRSLRGRNGGYELK